MLKTDANPGGLPIEAFRSDTRRRAGRPSQLFKDLSAPFYAPIGRELSVAGVKGPLSGYRDGAGHKAVFDCIKFFSETDFTNDLRKFDVPTLILHGDDDQIVPIGAAALLSSKIARRHPQEFTLELPMECAPR